MLLFCCTEGTRLVAGVSTVLAKAKLLYGNVLSIRIATFKYKAFYTARQIGKACEATNRVVEQVYFICK
jgi:hypothetical protein